MKADDAYDVDSRKAFQRIATVLSSQPELVNALRKQGRRWLQEKELRVAVFEFAQMQRLEQIERQADDRPVDEREGAEREAAERRAAEYSAEIIRALEHPGYEWRTIDGVAAETGISFEEIDKFINEHPEIVIKSNVPRDDRTDLYTTWKHFNYHETLRLNKDKVHKELDNARPIGLTATELSSRTDLSENDVLNALNYFRDVFVVETHDDEDTWMLRPTDEDLGDARPSV